jgi:hypothetical protein
VNKLFRFEGWHGTLRLVRIDRPQLPNWPAHIRPPFTLIFEGPRGDVMPEGFRTAIVDEGVRFEFNIMPIHTPAGDRQDYQAVFS